MTSTASPNSPAGKPPSSSAKQKPKPQTEWDLLGKRAILLGTGIALGAVLINNIQPYSAAVESMLRGLVTMPLVGWALSVAGVLRIAGFLIGTGLFVAIQVAETLPTLMRGSPRRFRNRHYARDYRMACLVMAAAFAVDVVACTIFWPPLSVDWETARAAWDWGYVNWRNTGIMLCTIGGGWLYAKLWVALKGWKDND